ncbi:MAG: hypothetical protein NWE83_14800 [Candidatus Bathyarchaeota archaeon]|jgi:hypothetical protein|nr:hypothetical protein [Candidatus Bathyarchaeota archaeon]
MKKGRFSNEEMDFIEQNCEVLSHEAIAKTLDRDPDSIRDWIAKKVGITASQKKEAAVANELKTKPYYKELLNQFSQEELEMFQFHFKKMWSQFKDDVFHTEEMQIIDTIKLEVLMNRILRSQHENQQEIALTERLIQNEKSRDRDQRDVDYLMNLERQVAVLRASQETLSKDYKDLQGRKATMLKDLKGTREQRIKAIEDSKETFASFVKELATNEDFRTKIGIEMEKMRLATEVEKERISEYTLYEDGTVDQPFLTPETLIKKED